MREEQSIKGKLQLRLVNRRGEVLEEQRVNNMITMSGKQIIAELFAGRAEIERVRYFGVGTSSQSTTEHTTGLGQEVQILKTQYRKALTGQPKIELERDEAGQATGRIKVLLRGELDFEEPRGQDPLEQNPILLTEAGLFNDKRAVTFSDDPPDQDPPPNGPGGGFDPRPNPGGLELDPDISRDPIPGPKPGGGDNRRTFSLAAQASPGHLYNRVVFSSIEKTADFKLQLFWEIIF